MPYKKVIYKIIHTDPANLKQEDEDKLLIARNFLMEMDKLKMIQTHNWSLYFPSNAIPDSIGSLLGWNHISQRATNKYAIAILWLMKIK